MNCQIYFFVVFAFMTSVSSATFAKDIRFLTWNVESGGNKPSVIADQLAELDRYDILALTEVDPANSSRYRDAISAAHGTQFRVVVSSTGDKNRTLFLYDANRITLRETYELSAHDGQRMNTTDSRYRSPLVGHFQIEKSNLEFLVVLVHLARGKEEVRQMQSKSLRIWAKHRQLPVIGLGDFNFDYEFATGKGNRAFEIFLADGIWKWVKPAKLVDTNWYDPEPDGVDNYPGSCLDFTFVAGPAKELTATSRVIERPGDFPDNEMTSDHRPVELVIEFDQPASAARQQ